MINDFIKSSRKVHEQVRFILNQKGSYIGGDESHSYSNFKILSVYIRDSQVWAEIEQISTIDYETRILRFEYHMFDKTPAEVSSHYEFIYIKWAEQVSLSQARWQTKNDSNRREEYERLREEFEDK
jgi:hypothetical protein